MICTGLAIASEPASDEEGAQMSLRPTELPSI